MDRYNPKKIETKWKKKWLIEKVYEPDFRRYEKPFYNLMMFPYPSAEGLHIGGVRTFTGVDIYGRFKRMQGHDVFEPIGLDGFGIHSENYALKIGKHPAKLAKVTEKNFYRQLSEIGNGFAWDERLETYDPDYYKWTQWIFIQLFKKGLAYRKKAAVNWCPSCKTVLADEQVIAGKCERCGTIVEKRDLEQWFFKITDYAERLLKNIDSIDWDERVKIAQRNWIGKSEGALIRFSLVGIAGQEDGKHNVEVFTTRPDTLFGATFIVVSPELAQKWMNVGWQANVEVKKYIETSLKKNETDRIAEGREKTGVPAGIHAVNPANKEKIPVWIADYVLGNVGTGAIMAVPAHDERDYNFAKKFDLPIRTVIEPLYTQTTEPGKLKDELPVEERDAIIAIVKHWAEEKFIALRWKEVAWGTFVTGGIEKGQRPEEAARTEIKEETGYTNLRCVRQLGVVHGKFYHVPKKVNRLAHSRILYFELTDGARETVSKDEEAKHDVLWLTKNELAAFLTPDTHKRSLEVLNGSEVYTGEGLLTGSGEFNGHHSNEAKWGITSYVKGERKTNYRLRDWLISRQRYWGPPIPMIHCDDCGWQPVPEKDLPVKLPVIKEFRPTGTGKSPLASVKSFYETTCPKCGKKARRETDVSDTFLDSAWYFLRYPSVGEKDEPWNRETTKKWLPVHMYIGGLEHSVLHLLYSRFVTMALHDFGLLGFEEPFKTFIGHGLITKDGAKMSKSKGNVVNPDEYLRAYGADALRMYLAFLSPLTEGGDFRDSGIKGITRFLERVWKFSDGVEKESKDKKSDPSIEKALNEAIKKVTRDIQALQYNTAISSLMILLNAFEERSEEVTEKEWNVFLKLLAPFAPFLSEELWQRSRKGAFVSLHREEWPRHDESVLREATFSLIVQVNGKVRGKVTLASGASQSDAEKAARALPAIGQLVTGTPKRIIYVPQKLINFVV